MRSNSFENSRSSEKRGEKRSEKLQGLLGVIAGEINGELKQHVGRDVLNTDGTINMDVFQTKKGGPYRKEDGEGNIKADKQFIKEREIEWSDANDANVQKHYGVTTADGVVEQFRKNKQETKGALVEMAVTGVFYKILRDEFLVVRSATYDDYASGVDNVIVNKETGDVVCTFDELYDERDGERRVQKSEKMFKKAERSGATIKYGLTFEKDASGKKQLVRRSIEHVPSFYLAVSAGEFENLLGGMNYTTETVTPAELKLFDTLVTALEAQAAALAKGEAVHPKIKANIQKFQQSLGRMKELRRKIKSA